MAKTVSPSYTPSSNAAPSVPSVPSTPASNPVPTAPAPSPAPVPTGTDNGNTGVGGDVKSSESKIGEPTLTLEEKDEVLPKGHAWKEDLPKKSEAKSGETVEIKLLHGVTIKRDAELYYVAASTKKDEIKGYLVKASAVENTNKPQTVSVSDVVELYDWAEELKLMFPDVETIRHNALLSFWRAGALFETDKANAQVMSTMFDSAYPYRMP